MNRNNDETIKDKLVIIRAVLDLIKDDTLFAKMDNDAESKHFDNIESSVEYIQIIINEINDKLGY
jgi:hypothetical protein